MPPRDAHGGWPAAYLERTSLMKPTPVRRILKVLAVVLLLLVLMVIAATGMARGVTFG